MTSQNVTIGEFVAEAETVINQLSPELDYRPADLWSWVSAAWPYDGTPADAASEFVNKLTIEVGIKQIEEALGDYLCTNEQPCAALAYYDEGEAKPWRIADDHASERFATLEEAIDGAEAWAEAMEAG